MLCINHLTYLGNRYQRPLAIEQGGTISARALVKKTQEPGIKLQKADFFKNDTWTSPQTNSEEAPKITLVHFF